MESLAPDGIAHRWVLDKGECSLLGYFGDDKLIADTARVSYRKGTKQTSTDSQLIRYLMRNVHTGPFEHAMARFYIKAPLFVLQQLLRHRTFKFNQASARYSEMLNEAYVPMVEHITTQDSKNKQARTDQKLPAAQAIMVAMDNESQASFDHYNEYLEEGVARELARINLPHGTYSELIVTADLHNLMHFLKLRLHPHAQYEIRVYAEAMMEMVAPLFPATFAAFKDCVLDAYTLTGQMQEALSSLVGLLILADGSMTAEDGINHTLNQFGWHSSSEKAQFAQWAKNLLHARKQDGVEGNKG